LEPRISLHDALTARRRILAEYQSPRKRDRYWLHILLFLLTLASVVYTGGLLVGRLLAYEDTRLLFTIGEGAAALPITTGLLLDGLRFGLSLLAFLTVHEFGHYIAARHHKVDTSLPYYIPLPLVLWGTLGAVIRIREPIPTTRKLFDIGAAGPLAGFVVALGLLVFGLATLPPPEYLLDLPGHEGLKAFIRAEGTFPAEMPAEMSGTGTGIVAGQTLLYWALSQFFPNVPPMYEIYHYPFLFAGWLGLFFTALNLLPVGQLDGGHVLYALVGPKWHARLARGFVVVLLISGAIGFMDDVAPEIEQLYELTSGYSWVILAGILYLFLRRVFNGEHRMILPVLGGIVAITWLAGLMGPVASRFGYYGWFVFGILVVFLVRIDHPPVLYTEPLTPRRRALGVLCIVIFFLCFSIRPLYIV